MAVTRPRSDPHPSAGRGDRLSALLRARGFRPIHHPTTRILPPEDFGPLDRAARRIADYDWVVVTSARAVAPLVEALERAGTVRDGPGRVCAVGPRTARTLEAAGIPVELVPERFVAEGVVEVLLGAERSGAVELAGSRVLLPRAEEGRDVIPSELRAAGARVDVVAAYRTEADPDGAAGLAAAVQRGDVDILTFTAGSAARSFAAAWRGERGGASATTARIEARVAAIGPVTAAVLEQEGLPVERVADPHTLEGLVDAVTEMARNMPR